MNINRDNYESFFLLYTDNELAETDRKAVELFVKDNADLEQELKMLQQSIVQPDKIVFKGKNSLLKTEILTAATEEKLLLYIDNELSAPMIKELDAMVMSDNQLANELSLLQQTKLSAEDDIVFPDKNLLYKQERERVISFGWWKLAAAAVFIGFGIWGMKVYVNRPASDTGIAIATKAVVAPAGLVKETPVKKLSEEPAVTATAVVEAKDASMQKKVKPALQIKEQRIIVPEEKVLAKQEKPAVKPSNNLPKPYFENINNPSSNQNEVAIVSPQIQQNNLPAGNNTSANKNIKQPSGDNNVYTAAFSETANDSKEDQFTFSEDEPKKSRVGGFLRKAKRLLERNTKIKSGDNNLKVANLEFAIQ